MDGWNLGTHGWELALLRIVDALQRTRMAVTTADIYAVLEKGTFKELSERDMRKPPGWGGLPAYRYTVLAYLSNLARGKRPCLERVSRGAYRITENGKWRIERTLSYPMT